MALYQLLQIFIFPHKVPVVLINIQLFHQLAMFVTNKKCMLPIYNKLNVLQVESFFATLEKRSC